MKIEDINKLTRGDLPVSFSVSSKSLENNLYEIHRLQQINKRIKIYNSLFYFCLGVITALIFLLIVL